MDSVLYRLWAVFRAYLRQETDVDWLRLLRQEIVKVNKSLTEQGVGLGLEVDVLQFVDNRITALSDAVLPDIPPPAAPAPPPLPPPVKETEPKPFAVKRRSGEEKKRAAPLTQSGHVDLSALLSQKAKMKPVAPRVKSALDITKDVEDESDVNSRSATVVGFFFFFFFCRCRKFIVSGAQNEGDFGNNECCRGWSESSGRVW